VINLIEGNGHNVGPNHHVTLVSLARLTAEQRDRYSELAVLAIPGALLRRRITAVGRLG
jgi:hypothetical protein